MHLAIISNIHGNCFAFDRVLKDIRQQGIEHMVCLGDTLQGGAQPAETLARLRELHCPVVMGNADAWLMTGQQTSPGEHTSEQQHAVRAWSLAQLSENDVWAIAGMSILEASAWPITGSFQTWPQGRCESIPGLIMPSSPLKEHVWASPFVTFLSMWMSLLASSAPVADHMRKRP